MRSSTDLTLHGNHQPSMATREENRQAILDAADALYGEYGALKTSVADIARVVGMSPSNVYNFFPSRDAIIEAVGERHMRAVQARLTREIDRIVEPWTRIETLFLGVAKQLRTKLKNEKDILQLLAIERKQGWRFVAAFHEFLRSQVERILRDGAAARRIRVTDPEDDSLALFACMATAVEPLYVTQLDGPTHAKRLKAQLALLERAFR
jgi:AcrR family transcriptional regulator